MKGTFINLISYRSKEELQSSGVFKKVQAQYSVLNRYFEMQHDMINGIDYVRARNLRDFIYVRLPYTGIMTNWKYKREYSDCDFIYFRKPVIDRTVRKLFKQIKEKNQNTIILMEIPTYPYDKEWAGIKKLPFLLKDKYNRNRLKPYVDRIVTMSDDDTIFGIPTIKMMNGIDFSAIEINPKNFTQDINIISVSSYGDRHGCDRLIAGIGEYKKMGGLRNITFHIVGPGVPKEYYDLVKKYSIEDNVIFYGKLSGDELNKVYAKCNMGVDVLALHRVGLKSISTLKSREYGARGLPFFSCSKIDYLPEDYLYYKKVESNDKPINIQEIIEFFDKVYFEEKDVRTEIRNYAEKKCDMQYTMQPVVSFLKGVQKK